MDLTERIFLTGLLGGILCLVTGLLVTRFNWRDEVPQYRRSTTIFDVVMHPDRYAHVRMVPLIRMLNAVGGILLLLAMLALLWQASVLVTS